MNQESNDNWMPLESNPQVINPYIQKMGLKLDQFSFQEMLSTQEWALEMIPKPSIGILFLYNQTPVQQEFKEQESASLKPQESPANVFFMKQYAKNACGTIALFHIILNAADKYPTILTQGSYLDTFKNNSINGDPHARGQSFKNSKDILQEHKQAVSQGQSSQQAQCDSHFIAFIPKNGRIYELDGFKSCPVDHGACSEEQFLIKGSQLIKEFMARDPDNLNFSMIVLAANPSE